MPRTSKRLQQRAWDATNARYASLDFPEWLQVSRLPVHFWDDHHNHKRYMQWLGDELGFTKTEDWYEVTWKDFTSRRGWGFLDCYSGSVLKALQAFFPKFDWKPWLFYQAPSGFWKGLENCLAYVQWFEKQRKFESIEDWYGISQHDVYELGGSGMMDRFDCSVQRLINSVYPEHDWKPWLFVQVPKDFWPHKKNRIAYLRWLEGHLGFEIPEDWYGVTKKDFADNQGASLFQYGNRTIDLARELYPKLDWHPWLFKQISTGHWDKRTNRIKYLQWLGRQLGYKHKRDWLKIKQKDFAKHSGTSLYTDYYLGNLLKAVNELFPKCGFKAWEFSQVPNGFWDNPTNCRSYLNWLGKRLGITKKDDWHQVKRADFHDNFGGGFIKRFKLPFLGLEAAYPSHNWHPWRLDRVPMGFWADEDNRNRYLEWLGKRLCLRSQEAWLKLTADELRSNHGNGLIAKMSVKEIRVAGASLAKTSN